MEKTKREFGKIFSKLNSRSGLVVGAIVFYAILFVLLLISGCSLVSRGLVKESPAREILIKVQPLEPAKISTSDDDKIKLSALSFLFDKIGYIQIYGIISSYDAKNIWTDFLLFEKKHKVKEIKIYLNSPGGSAQSALALADEISSVKKRGIEVTGYASGIVASAAMPIFAVCNKRVASKTTIFMVHEAGLWKWPGFETRKDLRSQQEMMEIGRNHYLNILADHTNLSFDEWAAMEDRTTYFTAKQALEWGLVDELR